MNGFRFPLFATLAALAVQACHALDDHLAQADPPPPEPLPPEPEGPRGFQPFEVGVIFSALESGGALAVVGNDGPFLGHVLGQIQARAIPGVPTLEDVRAVLDAAIEGYGGPDFPKLSAEVVEAVHAAVVAGFTPQAPPES